MIDYRGIGAVLCGLVCVSAAAAAQPGLQQPKLTAAERSALAAVYRCELSSKSPDEKEQAQLELALRAEKKLMPPRKPGQSDSDDAQLLGRHRVWGTMESELSGAAGQGFFVLIATSKDAQIDQVLSEMRQSGIPLTFNAEASANRRYKVYTARTPISGSTGAGRSIWLADAVVSFDERYEGPGVTVSCSIN